MVVVQIQYATFVSPCSARGDMHKYLATNMAQLGESQCWGVGAGISLWLVVRGEPWVVLKEGWVGQGEGNPCEVLGSGCL